MIVRDGVENAKPATTDVSVAEDVDMEAASVEMIEERDAS